VVIVRQSVRVYFVTLGFGCLLLSAIAAAADAVPYSPDLPAGAICTVSIDRLHPTQFAVGKWEVERRAENIARKKAKALKRYLDEHQAKIVIGPRGVPYLIDGHHLSLALLKAKVATTVDARVEANWHELKPEEFWERMKQTKRVYLYRCGKGPFSPTQLPTGVAELADDPYRSLAWAVKERGGIKKSPVSFSEFEWADFFRSRIAIGNTPDSFERAITAALQLCHSPEAKNLPGHIPPRGDHSQAEGKRWGQGEKGGGKGVMAPERIARQWFATPFSQCFWRPQANPSNPIAPMARRTVVEGSGTVVNDNMPAASVKSHFRDPEMQVQTSSV
jgi:hypothetical protein